ncbi:hypothetical protein AB0N62_42410 [Streptomyces sp. NPDC093982]|uniref:hypothetical protein n=1 Tax=Streptomyces sp. NPDC093982 TaxID=3155077 RepID=UPI00341A0C3E
MTRSVPPSTPEDDPDYSATALASHWFCYTDSHEQATRQLSEPEQTQRLEDSTELLPAASDTTEVLRFGPGVPSRPHPLSTVLPPRERRRWAYRYVLAVAVLLSVLGFLVWQWQSPPIAVESVTTSTEPARPGCDSTVDVVAVITTNGAPGIVTYRWTRSDGTKSALQEEKLAKGQRQARLHLLWSFRGRGTHAAKAQLHITTPEKHAATAQFTYSCP